MAHGRTVGLHGISRKPAEHGDAVIRQAQEWLRQYYSHPNPVEAFEKQSDLPPRSFKRRFKKATGLNSLAYIQQLRVERAKSLLESSDTPVDNISWRVGYEDTAFFRRLFKRVTGLTPRDYRKKFQLHFTALRDGDSLHFSRKRAA